MRPLKIRMISELVLALSSRNDRRREEDSESIGRDVHTPRPCSIITQPSSDEKEVNLIDAIASQGFSIDLALLT